MFCSVCGESVSGGKAFCKNCGAPIQAWQPAEVAETEIVARAHEAAEAETVAQSSDWSTAVRPPVDVGGPESSVVMPQVADAHMLVPPPVTGAFRAAAAPPLPPPPSPAPRDKSKTGLIVGIGVAVIIIIAAAAVATILLIRDSDTSASVITTVAVSTSATPTSTTIAPSTTVTEAPPTTTLAVTTTVTIDPVQQYLAATDAVATLLTEDDIRIPELAKDINATAPNVPSSVYDELKDMFDELNAAKADLDLAQPPAPFQQSHQWLDEATAWMLDRIHATMLGVEAMVDAGNAASGTAHFKQGQVARDKFRAAFQKYHDAVPVN